MTQRDASQTITLGVRTLHGAGDLSAARLRSLTAADIQQLFQLPYDMALMVLVEQLHTVLHQAGPCSNVSAWRTLRLSATRPCG